MTWPRLLPERQARKYLGGLDPLIELGVAPRFHKGERYYDRVLIDRALDGDRGLAPPQGDDPDDALQAWRESRGSA